jgi:general secretion pathway protein H
MRGVRDTSARAGFVLLELLAVMMILALAVAVGTTALSHRASATPLQVAEQVQGAMQRARAEAMRTGTDTAVTIDLARRRVDYLPGATPIALPPTMRIRVRTGAGLVSAEGAARLVFRADGSSSGGALRFEEAGRAAGIEVSWLTGLPRLDGGSDR